MKSTEIYKIISRDPDAEFAIKPRLSHFPRGVTLVRGLERADLPGLWKYREVRYQMSDQWVVPEPDRVFPDMHLKVKSRDLMDADQARAMVRKQVGVASSVKRWRRIMMKSDIEREPSAFTSPRM